MGIENVSLQLHGGLLSSERAWGPVARNNLTTMRTNQTTPILSECFFLHLALFPKQISAFPHSTLSFPVSLSLLLCFLCFPSRTLFSVPSTVHFLLLHPTKTQSLIKIP